MCPAFGSALSSAELTELPVFPLRVNFFPCILSNWAMIVDPSFDCHHLSAVLRLDDFVSTTSTVVGIFSAPVRFTLCPNTNEFVLSRSRHHFRGTAEDIHGSEQTWTPRYLLNSLQPQGNTSPPFRPGVMIRKLWGRYVKALLLAQGRQVNKEMKGQATSRTKAGRLT
jgi:hypothetical protein